MDKRMRYPSAAEHAAELPVRGASWKDFVTLTKPTIILWNLVAAFGGYWLASRWNFDSFDTMAFMLLGTMLTMASSTVINNYWDRDFDMKMARTSKRPLPSGRLSPNVVLWYGILLGVAGIAILYWLVSPLCTLLGLIGMIVYIGIYTMWLKRTSTLSTAVGALSGAMPPVIGYCSVAGTMDMGAWLLLAILFLWQPPHFWALAIRRKEEYRAAGFPLLPVVKGVMRTKVQMIPYITLLIVATVLLYVYEYVGIIYLISALVLGLYWLYLALSGFRAKDTDKWAFKTFMFSNNYLVLTFVIMMIDTARG